MREDSARRQPPLMSRRMYNRRTKAGASGGAEITSKGLDAVDAAAIRLLVEHVVSTTAIAGAPPSSHSAVVVKEIRRHTRDSGSEVQKLDVSKRDGLEAVERGLSQLSGAGTR